MNERKIEETELSSAPMELLAQGASIVKLENDVQMQIAVQRPRDEKKILELSLRELDLYPSMAKEAIYRKPVGKDETGQMKYADGPSIRMAESLGNRWANSSYGLTVVSEDEESATIAGVFLDYELNTRHVIEAKVSKWYKTSKGQVVRHAPDRFSDLILKANGSKILREVILRSLPAGLRKEYEFKAREVMKMEPIAQQRKALLERFIELQGSQEMLEKWKEKPLIKWSKEDIIDALGLANAIRDGEATIEGVFGKTEDKQPEMPGLKAKG